MQLPKSTVQLEPIGQEHPVSHILTNAPLVLFGMAILVSPIQLNVLLALSGTELHAKHSNVNAQQE